MTLVDVHVFWAAEHQVIHFHLLIKSQFLLGRPISYDSEDTALQSGFGASSKRTKAWKTTVRCPYPYILKP